MQPLISVIIPCYKVEQYLPKCIDSILRQTYKNLEIFLVDDGSPDKCGDICDSYAQNDSRIKVIHKKNGGLSDARNVAIDIAQGEYITFIDSDDYVADDYVETLYNLIKEVGCKLSITDVVFYKEGENVCAKPANGNPIILNPSEAVETMFYQEHFDNSAYAKLYHRSLFASGIRYPQGLIFEDLATTYRLMLDSDKVVYLNKPTYYYLVRNTSLEGAYSPKKIKDAFTVIKSLEDNLTEHNSLKRSFICRKLSFFFHIYLALPPNEKNKKEVVKMIKENRHIVLFDSKARKKARIAALCSYVGLGLVSFLFRFVNKR